ncbi:GntR family transcriptional regulator [Sphingomonas sp.]|jgi:DNA-binding GntR family transcriptional regulator|uniref:GntR family transcriptional regulator n=1 Tax=Sphingomonas sp. TaxID=28214 RepID=UPI002EDA75B3
MIERLTDRIAREIVGHIRAQRLGEGDRLRAQELADRFRVSRAPVTAALRALEAEGVVCAVPNRGFFVGAGASEARIEPIDEDPLYGAIVEARLAGSLAERASENEMMRRFGVARGRLQRTLAQIAKEGWVERLPGHGWQFRAALATAVSYAQAYAFRATIETEALRQPGYQVVPVEMERLRGEQTMLLRGAMFTLPRARLFEINAAYHETLVGWSNNGFFLDALRRVNRLRRLIEFRATGDRSRLEQQCREHLALLDLVERGDMALAADFLRGHIGHALALKVTET